MTVKAATKRAFDKGYFVNRVNAHKYIVVYRGTSVIYSSSKDFIAWVKQWLGEGK